MARRKSTAKSARAACTSNGRHAKTKTAAGSVLAQASKTGARHKTGHSQPSADELALRAWQTTYRNNRKSKEA